MQGNYIKLFGGAAPMNDPKAVVYLAIDNHKNTIQYDITKVEKESLVDDAMLMNFECGIRDY